MAGRLHGFFGLGLATVTMALVAPLAFGGELGISVIDVNSGQNLSTEGNNYNGGSPDVVVTVPAFLWQPDGTAATSPNGAAYSWVSYGQTGRVCSGYNGVGVDSAEPQCPENGTEVTFTKTFTLPDPYNAGYINIWADDSATVYVNGIEVYAENTTLGPNCADAPIGCIAGVDPQVNGQVLISPGCNNSNALSTHCVDLGPGAITLTIDDYQLGGGPFGVLYQGTISSEFVPEPDTYALLGFGLMGLMLASKRLKRRA